MTLDNANTTLAPRETRTVSFEIDDNASVQYNVRKEIALHFVFTRFATDVYSTVTEVRFKNKA